MVAFAWYQEPPAQRSYGQCHPQGTILCYDVQLTSNPSFQLFHVPTPEQPDHTPGLAKLAVEMNEIFQEKARALIKEERARALKAGRIKDPTELDLDVSVRNWGIQPVFAVKAPAADGNGGQVRKPHEPLDVEAVIRLGKEAYERPKQPPTLRPKV